MKVLTVITGNIGNALTDNFMGTWTLRRHYDT